MAMLEHKDHQLDKTAKGYHCGRCNWDWVQLPDTECPRVPRYTYETQPEWMKTKSQLTRDLCMTPVGEPVGCRYQNADHNFIYLYDMRLATQRRKTPARLAREERDRRWQAEQDERNRRQREQLEQIRASRQATVATECQQASE